MTLKITPAAALLLFCSSPAVRAAEGKAFSASRCTAAPAEAA